MLLGVERAVVEDVRVEREAIVVSVRPKSREKHRCGVCGRCCPREDSGEGRRRWRALDLGATFAYLEADAPRVHCKRHRVVVAAVPWARHDSRFTVAFEDQLGWLAVNTSKRAVSQLMRVTSQAAQGPPRPAEQRYRRRTATRRSPSSSASRGPHGPV